MLAPEVAAPTAGGLERRRCPQPRRSLFHCRRGEIVPAIVRRRYRNIRPPGKPGLPSSATVSILTSVGGHGRRATQLPKFEMRVLVRLQSRRERVTRRV